MISQALQRLIDRAAGPDARTRRRRGRAGSAAASVALHLIFFVLITASLGGAVVTGGAGAEDGEVGAIDISLAGPRGGARAAQTPSSAQLEALFHKILNQQSPVTAPDKPAPPKTSLDKLYDAIDRERAPRDAPAKRPGQGQTDKGGSGASTTGSPTKAPDKQGKPTNPHAADGPGSAASSGWLWGQIEPCWSRLPQVSTVPVTLEIRLDLRGKIAKPPRILRPNTAAPDERRLISEARALAAVTACVPYHGAASGEGLGVYRVDFGAQGAVRK
jgi:hypothetical protein